MKARRWAPSKPDMTTPKTLPERLLDTAENIHSRGPVIAADLMKEAARHLRAAMERPAVAPLFDNPAQPDVARDDFLELIKAMADIVTDPACSVGTIGDKAAGLDTAAALLRLAHQRRAFETDWSELDSLRASVGGYREHFHELGQHLIAAHKPGDVDEAAVAILDGYHVGAREVAGGGAGEPGEDTVAAALRLLKLALARGAFRLPQFTDLTPEQEAAAALFRPHVSVVRMQVDGQWQGFYRAGILEGFVVQADDVPTAERAVAFELAARAYPSIFPRPET